MNYVGTHAFTTACGVVSGDIKLSVSSFLVRSLGCNALSAGKTFALLLGWDKNMLTYSIPNSGLPLLVKIKTDIGFGILIQELPVCIIGQDEILCSQSIAMDQHSVKNVKNSIDGLDAVNKAYADRIKHKTPSGNIINTVLSDHILFIFPTGKAFASGKIKICEIVGWTVGWWVDSNIKANVRNWVAGLSQVFKRPIPCDIFLWFPW